MKWMENEVDDDKISPINDSQKENSPLRVLNCLDSSSFLIIPHPVVFPLASMIRLNE